MRRQSTAALSVVFVLSSSEVSFSGNFYFREKRKNLACKSIGRLLAKMDWKAREWAAVTAELWHGCQCYI